MLELASQVPVLPILLEVVAAALGLGCQTRLSEDLNHGEDYDRVRAGWLAYLGDERGRLTPFCQIVA